MPHKVSTTNKEEAEKTGKIYLDKEFYRYIGGLRLKKYKTCKNCGVVLRFTRSETYNKIDYCMECSPSNGYAGINKLKKKNEI